MKCAMCGYEFDPNSAEAVCDGCPLIGNCRMVRCPNCGYEALPEAGLIRWLRGVRDRMARGNGPKLRILERRTNHAIK